MKRNGNKQIANKCTNCSKECKLIVFFNADIFYCKDYKNTTKNPRGDVKNTQLK